MIPVKDKYPKYTRGDVEENLCEEELEKTRDIAWIVL